MTGYKYTTEQDAQTAVALCDTHYGYPKSNCVTEHWCECIYSELDGFWYITYDESIEAVLGAPSTFDVTIPELN